MINKTLRNKIAIILLNLQRRTIFISVASVVLAFICSLFTSGCAALEEEYLSDSIVRIRNGSYGKLLYDAALLEPHNGPGMKYLPAPLFNQKKDTEVLVLSIADDETGNQWALVEGFADKGLMRVYLLYYDVKNAKHTILLEKPELLPKEAEANFGLDACFLEKTFFRTGPGEWYLLVDEIFDDKMECAVVAINKGWALVECFYEGTEDIVRFRGWVPYEAIYGY